MQSPVDTDCSHYIEFLRCAMADSDLNPALIFFVQRDTLLKESDLSFSPDDRHQIITTSLHEHFEHLQLSISPVYVMTSLGMDNCVVCGYIGNYITSLYVTIQCLPKFPVAVLSAVR